MAQLPGVAPNARPQEQSSQKLGLILSRFQQTLLHPDPKQERRLRTDQYERRKFATNLEYARNSLTTLEKEAMAILSPRRRAEVQADLNGKRELLEVLLDRLQDYNKMAENEATDDEMSEGEDLLAHVAHLMPKATETSQQAQPAARPQIPEPTATITSPAPTQPAPTSAPTQPQPAHTTQTTQTLRPRGARKTGASPTTTETPTTGYSSGLKDQPSWQTTRAALFANRRAAAGPTSPEASTATAEAILDRQAAEREDLTEKVFKMAQAMKKQQEKVFESLETEKDLLSRAAEGAERTGQGMDIARGRMGTLQRMAEGQGWWGRMKLYAMIYGLMVALVLLVFVMPKLRLRS